MPSFHWLDFIKARRSLYVSELEGLLCNFFYKKLYAQETMEALMYLLFELMFY